MEKLANVVHAKKKKEFLLSLAGRKFLKSLEI